MKRLLVVILFVTSVALVYWYWTTTPQYSIGQVKEAVKNHDLQKFQKYVDVEGVASAMVDDVVTRPIENTAGRGIIGHLLGAGISGFVKPHLVASFRDDIKSFVESGDFSSQDGSDSNVSLRALDGRLGFKKHAFKRIEEIKTEGKVGEATILLHNEKYDQDVQLVVKLRESGGYWEITQIANFPQFMKKLIAMQVEGPPEKQNGKEDGSDPSVPFKKEHKSASPDMI